MVGSKYEERYRKCKVAERVPDFKLKKLQLTPDANQWDLIKAGESMLSPAPACSSSASTASLPSHA